MAVKHAFTSPKADGADATLVRPSNWNADHTAEGSIEFLIGGGTGVIAPGIKGDIVMPYSGTFVTWTLLADASGSIVVDLWKDTYANYPPTVADVLTVHPTITTATKATGAITSTFTKGDILRINVASATTVTRVTLSLAVTEP